MRLRPGAEVNKVVRELGYCVELVIAQSFSSSMMSEIEAPEYWTYHIGIGIETDGECREASSRHSQQASSARGWVAWDEPEPSKLWPCSVDVDVELTFPGSDLIPMHDHLLVTDLPVDCEL